MILLSSIKIVVHSNMGFHKHCSSEHALLNIVGKIQKYMNEKLFFSWHFLLIYVAFDTVDHNILLYK